MIAAAEFDRVLEAESERFRDVLSGSEANRRVPSCSAWSAADLLWHLTEVQAFWAEIVARRLADPESVTRLTRPDDYGESLALFDTAHRSLTAALDGADDREAAWTWADEQTVGFIRRRQAHEALIHRVDAELTAGTEVRPVDPEVAADGVDEILTVMVDGIPAWGSFHPDAETLRLEADDLPHSWGLHFGRFRGTSPQSGNTYDLDTAVLETNPERSDCVVRGSSWDLDRWLWGRADESRVRSDGRTALASRLRSIIAEVTQ